LLAELRPTIFCAVPSVLEVLLRAADSWLTLDLSSLRFIVSAGEPLPIQVFEKYRDRFGVEVLDGLGSTELLSHVISNRPRHARAGTCGVPVPQVEVMLVDESGVPVGDNEIGTAWVRSVPSFVEYWRRPEVTARTKVDGWIATGDKLYRSSDGYYHFCGRTDDMIKVSGQWVLPREVESVICQHPAIESAVVTTRQDPSGRRRLVAYVVPAPGVAPTVSELVRDSSVRLPEHMMPSAFVVMSTIPRTPTGKVTRGALPEPSWS